MDLDVLRLVVVPTTPAARRFQVRAFVNGVDVTDGLGMKPFDVLVPVNRFAEPGTIPFASCRCGVYDCSGTAVTIRRTGDTVTWSGLDRDVRFAADAYDTEVARAAADRSWETPEQTAGRLVLTGLRLPTGVVATSMLGVHDDHFETVLEIPDGYQIQLRFPWTGDPDEVAREVRATLARPPAEWPARWHGIPPELRERPPAIAGPRWELWEL